MIEDKYVFAIYVAKKYLCKVLASSKWEAMDKAFSEYVGSIENLTRAKIIAKKLG